MTIVSANERDAPVRIEALQLEGFDRGPRFAVWWLPARTEPRGSVLCVQPLGDEHPAARHSLALQARRLAARGWAVLMIDLFGTGDSPGEFAQANLEIWRNDLLRGSMLARQRASGPTVLWGVRGGALLVGDIAVALDQLVDSFVFRDAPDSGHAGGAGAVAGWRPPSAPEPTAQATPASTPGSLPGELRDLRLRPPPAAEHGAPPKVLFVEIGDQPAVSLELSPATCALTEAWLEAGYLATPRAAHAGGAWPGPVVPVPLAACMATEALLEELR